MSFNFKKEETKKNYTRAKGMSKYKNKLNRNAKPFVPKEINKKIFVEDINEDIKNKRTILYNKENIQSNIEANRQNNDKEKEIIKKYTYKEIKYFENIQRAKEQDLLTEEALDHINQMVNSLSENKMDNLLNKIRHSDSTISVCDTSKSSGGPIANIISLELWSRQDYTKEIKEAENNKKIFGDMDKKDAIKKELRDLLNKMTKDNYDSIMIKILEIIKDNIDNQDKFLDIIFLKSISEMSYVRLYAELCKDLDKELPQKIDIISKNKNKAKKKMTLFIYKLIQKCKEMVKFEETKKYEEYIKENNESEKKHKIKKIILGNSQLISELINNKLIPKKSACDCIDYLFKRYNETKNSIIKPLCIELIINFINNLGILMQNEKEEEEKNKRIQKKIKEGFEKLEKIREDENITSYIKYLIFNLKDKKENNYKQSKFEKAIIAKSKKELEGETKDKIEIKKLLEKEEVTQDDINELIKNDLYEYKWLKESDGSSEKFSWKITTDLYDVRLKKFDSILEGFFAGCSDFIDKKGNLQYAKDYIKEIIEYYNDKMEDSEKKSLINKIFDLYKYIKDIHLDIPDIFKIYEYVIALFIESGIVKVIDFKNIFETKLNNDEDTKKLNKMFRNVFNNIKNDIYRDEFNKLQIINLNAN